MILKAAIIFLLAHLALGVILWLRVRKLYSYPGLLGFPIFGNLYYFYKTLFLFSMNSMEEHMKRIADEYGEDGLCFHWIYGFRPSVIIFGPQVVKELAYHRHLSGKPGHMYSGFESYMEGPFTMAHSDGAWKEKRKEYNSCLKKWQVDNGYFHSFLKCGDKLIDSMLASAEAVDPLYEALRASHGVIIETLFGLETDLVLSPGILKLTKKILDMGGIVAGNPILGGIIFDMARTIDEIFMKKLAELRKLILNSTDDALVTNQGSLQELPLSAHIASRYTKGKEDKRILENELQELFLSSTQTVASVLSDSLIFLAVLPDVQDRAWKEQYEIFGNDKRDPTIDDLKQMQFLDRFIKEALRFLSPPFVGKIASEDININGVTIPRGTYAIYLTGYMKMDPKHWEDPEAFDPDRFLEESEALKHSYSPFGIGVRSCPGMYFATTLITITLSKLIRRMKLRPARKDFRFEDIRYKSRITTGIVNPPLLRVEERK